MCVDAGECVVLVGVVFADMCECVVLVRVVCMDVGGCVIISVCRVCM